ncbi:MAG: hypothetical protein IPM42_05070 [Saprospiraceae bacterium]|nr:hypothetical protein [Saprospiraceae bacterium]
MRKLIRILIFVILGIGILVGALVYFTNKSKPVVSPTKDADVLADKMLEALNVQGWDTLKYLHWNFKGARKYLWDKERNFAIISWEDTRVLINLNEISGKVFVNEKPAEGSQQKENLDKAWSYWCNDSFWMFAPFKVKDPGTVRSVGDDEDAVQSLIVSYESGGVTPGDTYLWLLDENFIPTGFKMWVKVIPVGGTYFSWENWKELPSGAKVALTHKNVLTSLEMTEVQEGRNFEDFGYLTDPFAEIFVQKSENIN